MHQLMKSRKMMMNMLKPKYIMPVIGEYRMQYAVMKLAKKQMGLSRRRCILNG